ncbi:unnamed protein product [Boreogadus saida]
MEGITQKKVCSFHFKPEDFELNVLGTKRVALLNTAIPSVFTVPYDDEQPGMSTTSSAKRMCLEEKPRFKQAYCKKSKQWILKTIFTPHTTEFISNLINRVMDRRHDPNIKLNVPTSSLTLAQPALPANIAPVPKPTKEAATTLFKSRF